MDTNNSNNSELNNYINMYDMNNINNEQDIFSARRRYDNNMYDNNRRYDYDRWYDDNRYDERYYRYPYCDRYGRCRNPIWWLFWPFFFF